MTDQNDLSAVLQNAIAGQLVNALARALADAGLLRTEQDEANARWKAEATVVLDEWEQVWEGLGRPGALGSSKAVASLEAIKANKQIADRVRGLRAFDWSKSRLREVKGHVESEHFTFETALDMFDYLLNGGEES